jgi:dimethylaniline monooxygenase (N-oxide forming)
MAFSGAEIAAELGDAGIDVTLVAARPAWIAPRYLPAPDGSPVPWDLAAARRAPAPTHRERNRALHDAGGNPGALDPRLRLDPASSRPPRVVFTDRLVGQVRDGRVAMAVGRVVDAGAHHLELDDGARVDCDAVVWCTGYGTALPLPELRTAPGVNLDDPLMPLLLDRATLHPALPDHAFVGLYRGPHLGVVELQARWASAVLAGAVPRPRRKESTAGLADARAIRDARPRPQFPYRDPVALGDRIASALGVLPEPGDVREDDPVVPAQYRFRGPGADPVAARLALESARRRMGTA